MTGKIDLSGKNDQCHFVVIIVSIMLYLFQYVKGTLAFYI